MVIVLLLGIVVGLLLSLSIVGFSALFGRVDYLKMRDQFTKGINSIEVCHSSRTKHCSGVTNHLKRINETLPKLSPTDELNILGYATECMIYSTYLENTTLMQDTVEDGLSKIQDICIDKGNCELVSEFEKCLVKYVPFGLNSTRSQPKLRKKVIEDWRSRGLDLYAVNTKNPADSMLSALDNSLVLTWLVQIHTH